MKKKFSILVIVIVSIFVLSFAKDTIIKVSVQGLGKSLTGLELKIGRLHLGIVQSLLNIRALKLYNPPGFQDRIMVDIPEVHADIEIAPLLSGNVHMNEMRLHLKELNIIRNANGELNLDALKPSSKTSDSQEPPASKSQAAPETTKSETEIYINKLKLRIDRVVYKDYSQGTPPVISEFRMDLNEEHHDIRDLKVLALLLVSRAVMNTAVNSLVDFDMKGYMSELDIDRLDLKQLDLEQYQGLADKFKGKAQDVLTKVKEAASGSGDSELGQKAGEAVEGVKELFKSLSE